ncbi:MAG: EH signature domain-containing protein, partial [Micrococcaceae bacterium]|nr:EH signature domain-containing protein [Micrococcaceae bacterium]
MATAGLLMVHLRYFSRLESWQSGLLAALSSRITQSIGNLEAKQDRKDVIEFTRSHAELILDPTGPETVARNSIRNGRSLEEFLDGAGLPGFDGGDYGEQIRLWYYVQQIHDADPATDHDFLAELTQPSVFKAPVQGGYFGHKILQAMSDKDQKPGTAWLDTILTIARDPRLEHTREWFEWWRPLPQSCIDRVKSWLSAQDLGLFLAAVEEYGIRSGQEDLQRMFPGRKAFLEGL